MRKIIIFFIIASAYAFSQSDKKHCIDDNSKMKLILMNDNSSRPIALNEKDFWKSGKLSEICFQDEVYFNLVNFQIKQFEKDSIPHHFSVCAAIILIQNNTIDTFYTTQFFGDWRKSNSSDTYTAQNDFLKKMFTPLYLGIYSDMNSGTY